MASSTESKDECWVVKYAEDDCASATKVMCLVSFRCLEENNSPRPLLTLEWTEAKDD